jgi:hypothetical protein
MFCGEYDGTCVFCVSCVSLFWYYDNARGFVMRIDIGYTPRSSIRKSSLCAYARRLIFFSPIYFGQVGDGTVFCASRKRGSGDLRRKGIIMQCAHQVAKELSLIERHSMMCKVQKA